jgi:hypothetical protein
MTLTRVASPRLSLRVRWVVLLKMIKKTTNITPEAKIR